MNTLAPDWQPLLLTDELTRLERYEREVFRSYFDGAIASGAAFLIFDQSSGELIGCTRYYDYNPEASGIAIGYTFLVRSHWGGRYNRSSKELLLDYAFRHVHQVFFHIGADNIRSQMGTTRIGAVRCGERELDFNGQQIMHYEYVIRKSDR
jgi:RimJ/RimL family protein N-acetyltransferase